MDDIIAGFDTKIHFLNFSSTPVAYRVLPILDATFLFGQSFLSKKKKKKPAFIYNQSF